MAEVTSGDVVVIVLTPTEAEALTDALVDAVRGDETGNHQPRLHSLFEALGVLD
jgi:hypothetical protein